MLEFKKKIEQPFVTKVYRIVEMWQFVERSLCNHLCEYA